MSKHRAPEHVGINLNWIIAKHYEELKFQRTSTTDQLTQGIRNTLFIELIGAIQKEADLASYGARLGAPVFEDIARFDRT